MPSTRPPYPAQFRAEAVRLIRESGRNWVVFGERSAFCMRTTRGEDVDELIQLIEAKRPSIKRVQRTDKSSRFDRAH